jgi:hypothetical protein
VLVAIIALIVIGLLAKKHKEVVPVAGAAALATEALRHASELAKMNEQMYWCVLRTFLAVTGVLVVLFFVAAIIDLRKRATAAPAAAPTAASASAAPASASAAGERKWRKRVAGLLGKWVAGLFGESDGQPESKENYLSTLGFSGWCCFGLR